MTATNRKTQLLAAAAIASVWAGAASAQDAASVGTVEDIVVTAQLREQDPIEVPFALTAYSGEFLDRLGIQEFDMEYVGPAFPLPPGAEAMYMVKAFASSTLINQVQTTAVPTDAQGANIPGFPGVGDVDQAGVIVTP